MSPLGWTPMQYGRHVEGGSCEDTGGRTMWQKTATYAPRREAWGETALPPPWSQASGLRNWEQISVCHYGTCYRSPSWPRQACHHRAGGSSSEATRLGLQAGLSASIESWNLTAALADSPDCCLMGGSALEAQNPHPDSWATRCLVASSVLGGINCELF